MKLIVKCAKFVNALPAVLEKTDLPFFLLFALVAFVYSYVSIIKHLHYQTFTWDTGFFDQLIWKLSRLKTPYSSFSNLNAFGDHFQFVLIFFAPLYLLPKNIYLLFTSQAVIATAGAIPIYAVAKTLDKSKLIAFSISAAYLMSVPLQFAILDGFHPDVFVPLAYAAAFWGLVKRNWWVYWLSIIVLLITKEEMALLAAALGVVVFITASRAKGMLTVALSFLIFFFAIYFFLPQIQGSYVHFNYGTLGYTPLDVLQNSLKNPLEVVKLLFTPQVKQKTVLESFLSFGFLPFASPVTLIPAAQQFFVRFIDTITLHRWTNLNHYAFPIPAILAISSIYGIAWLQKVFSNAKNLSFFIAIYLLVFALMQDYYLHAPINSILKKDFYVKKEWMKNNDMAISRIPQGASVAATNNLGPHLSQRDNFYLIDGKETNAEFLIFDLNDGPNKYSPLDYARIKEIVNRELSSQNYKMYSTDGDTYILKKQ